jgi:signal transduction histidine kinase
MELFVKDDEVAAMQRNLALLQGEARLAQMVELAWHLRERDSARAKQLAQEVDAYLCQVGGAQTRHAIWLARLILLDAELHWLQANIEVAVVLAEQALQRFTELDDAAGCCDAHWLRAFLALDSGMPIKRDAELDAALQYAGTLHDSIRQQVMEATLARFAILRGVVAAEQRWGKQFHPDMGPLPAAVACWAHDYLGMAAVQHGDYGSSAVFFMRSQEAAQQTGQIRRAINAQCNVAEAYTNLNDSYSALEWMQNALAVARQVGWPWSIGGCLYQLGESLRRMGRLDEAQQLLDEALLIMQPLANSRSFAIAMQYQADLLLDRQQYQAAHDMFVGLEARGKALRQFNLQIVGKRGQAHALSHLGQPERALAAAQEAWELARKTSDAHRQISVLEVLATIHSQYALPVAHPITEASPTLHYLLLAQQVARTIEGYRIPASLYDSLAQAYAVIGQHVKAYEMAMEAIGAYRRSHNQEATHRAIAVQVQRQTERAHAEGEHHRQLALAEARRAELLQQNSNTLEILGTVGQEITAQLDRKAVFQSLYRHTQGLLDMNTFVIYRADSESATLELAFGMENGQPLPGDTVALANAQAGSARCARERRMIQIDYPDSADEANLIPGTLANRSVLFAPLLVATRLLGVMSVQALQDGVYGAREQMIFRTLSAYGAIALDNAEAYDRLRQAQTQLIAHEKMAALGALVAGVAHELNTPLSNSMMMASALQERTDSLELLMRQHSLHQSDLQDYLADAQQATTLIMRGLSNAAKLVNSFKQVAVDRATAQRRQFDLAQTCDEVVATMMRQVRADGHHFDLDVNAGITMVSYPGALGQVIGNLINNALLHAFDGRVGGRISLLARPRGASRVIIEFRDNGCGIAKAHLARIFDPFFTTKMGQGSNGLGLSVSYNIVTSLLDGEITVQSTEGEGCVFTLDLPLVTQEK